jgi:hypothetical protein
VRNLRQQLTHDLVSRLDTDLGITEKIAMKTWWHNIRSTGGLRLTHAGYLVFGRVLDLTHYTFDITDPKSMTSDRLLEMDRKIQSPYYIMAKQMIPKQIIIFGSAEAVMINLYGDFKRWLDNYRP